MSARVPRNIRVKRRPRLQRAMTGTCEPNTEAQTLRAERREVRRRTISWYPHDLHEEPTHPGGQLRITPPRTSLVPRVSAGAARMLRPQLSTKRLRRTPHVDPAASRYLRRPRLEGSVRALHPCPPPPPPGALRSLPAPPKPPPGLTAISSTDAEWTEVLIPTRRPRWPIYLSAAAVVCTVAAVAMPQWSRLRMTPKTARQASQSGTSHTGDTPEAKQVNLQMPGAARRSVAAAALVRAETVPPSETVSPTAAALTTSTPTSEAVAAAPVAAAMQTTPPTTEAEEVEAEHSARSLLRRGRRHEARRWYVAAALNYERAFAAGGLPLQAATAAARAWIRAGEAAKALPWARHACAHDKKNAEHWLLLGDAERRVGSWEKALAAYQTAHSLDPEDGSARRRIKRLERAHAQAR